MSRIRILLVASFVVLALAVAGAVQASTQSTGKLVGTTGPGFTITLTKGGKAVKTLTAGKYMITVNDKSSSHNFHLLGPGVNKTTSVPFAGTKTWTVTLKKGTYTYRCDIHFASGMIGHFKVK
ncbi:MAG TPA: plastocyanin/azurin family copper-binding protein [Gaiellaceae bacterium]|jgi:plastocyanin